jgi:hypothetical protein
MITQDNFDTDFRDPVEEYQIDKFVCDEMSRQLHRYIKAMKGSHSHMLRFEERLRQLPQPERIQAIARYIDLNRHAIDGLDWKIVVVRAIANYSDTYSYFNKLLTNKERFEYYTDKIRNTYKQFHQVFEQDGKFGIRDHIGNILVSAQYDFLRTPYIYVDDLVSVPIIAQRNGKMGLLLADGKDTVVSPFIYDDIAVSEEPPYFEAVIDGHRGHLSIDGVFTKE